MMREPVKNESECLAVDAISERGAAALGGSRRQFLGGAATGVSLAMFGGVAHGQGYGQSHVPTTQATAGLGAELFPGVIDDAGQFVLPPLTFAYDALEPALDVETMHLHHDKHHAGYVRGVIAAEKALAEARTAGDFSMVEHYTQKLAFHGAGHFLHSIYWSNMTPKSTKPSAELAAAIGRDFGSRQTFEKQLFAATKSVEGSGWGVLAWSVPTGRLNILQARNHQYSNQWGNLPLLVVDVWEHAYYKKYGNLRGDYIKAYMGVINWESISRRFDIMRAMFG